METVVLDYRHYHESSSFKFPSKHNSRALAPSKTPTFVLLIKNVNLSSLFSCLFPVIYHCWKLLFVMNYGLSDLTTTKKDWENRLNRSFVCYCVFKWRPTKCAIYWGRD